MGPFKIAALVIGGLCSMTMVSGCYPVKLSPECRSAISACLANCDGQSGVTAPAIAPTSGQNVYPSDYRSPCEEACQSSCDH